MNVDFKFIIDGVDTVTSIDGYRAYPIYRMLFKFKKWTQPVEDKPTGNPTILGVFIEDSFMISRIFKEIASKEVLISDAENRWKRIKKKEESKGYEMELISVEIKLTRFETWSLRWYQHETFDQGLTDQEILQSFHNFVTRNEKHWDDDRKKPTLMGAEDRWRWRSSELDEDGERLPAPCRCKACKKLGLVRIDHI